MSYNLLHLIILNGSMFFSFLIIHIIVHLINNGILEAIKYGSNTPSTSFGVKEKRVFCQSGIYLFLLGRILISSLKRNLGFCFKQGPTAEKSWLL